MVMVLVGFNSTVYVDKDHEIVGLNLIEYSSNTKKEGFGELTRDDNTRKKNITKRRFFLLKNSRYLPKKLNSE